MASRRPTQTATDAVTSEKHWAHVGEAELLEAAPKTSASLHIAAVAIYLAGAVVLWSHVWIGGNPAHSITCNCGDVVQQVWWFEWLPWAVLHGHDPLLTNAIWSRMGGVNAFANTSWFAPAAVLSPITALFGPVASFNVANLCAPVLSGWAAFALAGRISSRTVARLVAGGLFAFSPYMLRNTVLGHIGLTLTAYLPVVLLLGLQLLSRDGRPIRIGLWLGLLTIIEFFTGFEVLAFAVITGAFCAIGVSICRPRLVVSAARRLLVAGSVGGLLTGVVLAYPLWFFVAGPRHVDAPIWPVSSASASGIWNAGPNVFSTHTVLTAVGYLGPQGPDTDYLGIGLLLAVAVSLPLWCRRRSCIILAGVGAVSWVLEFLPARMWAKVPFLSSMQLIRFALPVSLCMGLLLAASIDSWWGAVGRKWSTEGELGRRRTARIGVLVLTVAAFMPLVETYSIPFRITTATVPVWFERFAPRLPAGTAVVTIPFAYGIGSRPMGWQAETRDDFDLVGGWAFVPGGNGVNDEMVSALDGPVAALRSLGSDPRGATLEEQETIRAALTRWRPVVVVVVPQYAAAGTTAAVTATIGFSPTWSGGAWVWDLRATTRLGPLGLVPFRGG